MSTERDRMLAGELYDPRDPELVAARRRARDLVGRLNGSGDGELDLRGEIHAALFGSLGESVVIEPPFHCDYGTNIHMGDRVFLNYNCVVLDPAEVHIGSDVLLGPAVQVYTPTHPLDWRARRQHLESARPVAIGSDVWIGGGAMICPGIRVGARSVIGVGAVVTNDVPAGVVAAGNPCRTIRALE